MSDRDALLRAILDNPEDDAPRLIFADYIDERGEPERAELVRVQVELAKCQRCQGTGWRENPATENPMSDRVMCCQDKKSKLFRRRESLLLRGEKFWEWTAEFRDIVGKGIRADAGQLAGKPGWFITLSPAAKVSFTFRRGFIDQLELTAAAAITHLDSILAAQPVREVTLTTWPEVNYRDVDFGEIDIYLRPTGKKKRITQSDIAWRTWDQMRYEKVEGLLAAEWPRIKKWNLPEYSPSPLRAAFSVWQEARDAQAYSMRHF